MNETQQKSGKLIPVIKNLKLFDNGLDGELTGVKCNNCGEYFVGTLKFCLNCTNDKLEPVKFSKTGVLRTYTVIWVPPPGWQGDIPYILGSVELPEGVEVTTEVINCPRESIKIGTDMEMVLKIGGQDQEDNEIVVHKWQPIS